MHSISERCKCRTPAIRPSIARDGLTPKLVYAVPSPLTGRKPLGVSCQRVWARGSALLRSLRGRCNASILIAGGCCRRPRCMFGGAPASMRSAACRRIGCIPAAQFADGAHVGARFGARERRFFVYRNVEVFAYRSSAARRTLGNDRVYLEPLSGAARDPSLGARIEPSTHGTGSLRLLVGTFIFRGSWPGAPAADEAFGSIPIGESRLDMTVEDGHETGLLSERKGPTVLVVADKSLRRL